VRTISERRYGNCATVSRECTKNSNGKMPYRVHRCLLCGHTAIDTNTIGRFVTTACPACRAELRIEFDPPDQPELRACIERIDDPDDDRVRRVAVPEFVRSPGEAAASAPGRRTLRRFGT